MAERYRAARRRFLRAAVATVAGIGLAGPWMAWAEDEPVDPSATTPPTEPEPERDTVTEVAGPPVFTPSGVPPMALAIPSLGVDARITGVGQDEEGAMAAPTNPDEVAWYTLGPGMGVGGNVVFAGHIDWGGRLRVFSRLHTLDAGDAVLVVDAAGNGYQYVIEWSRWVRADGAPVEEIFAQSSAPTLTLITCGGEYRPETREYLDRLIVRARGA
ncbi:MAG: class F sortase [Chloroflexi bacterium]|nr:class F sortase [Chloroflexota bacterium]